MNIVEEYKLNKTRLKIFKNNIELYKNNYLNLDEDKCIKMINNLNLEINTLTEFNTKFINAHGLLNEYEKFFIEERYFKNKLLKEITNFYLENQDLIHTISPNIKHHVGLKSLKTIEGYLIAFNKKILSKLEGSVKNEL
ncbi:hypothetical protein IO99_17940 [Clostridium sulfidigenes]|uniref:Uncharacterized protein n=1 Tax=Clostridium sulfidigenes TaxID=318464 RepID=A0A084J7F0_9CLOT|nr:hypothetical protein [Clostridium sulfidigenes]KEZ84884.1 hypothetical protein IO99_17940 [Clostridium sulfidigenes]